VTAGGTARRRTMSQPKLTPESRFRSGQVEALLLSHEYHGVRETQEVETHKRLGQWEILFWQVGEQAFLWGVSRFVNRRVHAKARRRQGFEKGGMASAADVASCGEHPATNPSDAKPGLAARWGAHVPLTGTWRGLSRPPRAVTMPQSRS
jgi:hypothetical protein